MDKSFVLIFEKLHANNVTAPPINGTIVLKYKINDTKLFIIYSLSVLPKDESSAVGGVKPNFIKIASLIYLADDIK
jgi:hypothetical protein